ncbi:MAG: hypothetical protein BMS9Abin36_1532 [Gammaproteobacteria bacterium]|nr:MAG: hypothetical protein BMS9Abin36_1532 [Gammaproteobacteria bacterium]
MPQSKLNTELTGLVAKLQTNYQPLKALSSLYMKRKAFSHEAEVRAVFYNPNSSTQDSCIRVAVDPHSLIKSVLFDPRLPDELVPVYKLYLKEKLNYRGSVRKSVLYKQVKPIRVGEDEG